MHKTRQRGYAVAGIGLAPSGGADSDRFDLTTPSFSEADTAVVGGTGRYQNVTGTSHLTPLDPVTQTYQWTTSCTAYRRLSSRSRLSRSRCSGRREETRPAWGLSRRLGWVVGVSPDAASSWVAEHFGMRHSYRGLLSLPGARALVVSGLPARLPIAAYGIGLLALVREDYGSYAAGGVVAAAYTVMTMVAGPLTGRWCGRSWYRSALGWLSGLQLVTLACLVAWSALAYPLWILCVNAAALGLLVPPAGVLVRACWSTLVGGREKLDTALYLEGAFDEAAFIVGPMLVAGAGLVLGPPAALLSVGVITSAGCFALALMPGGFGPPAPARRPRRRLFSGPFSLQCVAFAALGGAFGCVQVACFAFAREHGEPWHAGPVLTAFSAVSLAAGVVGGVLPRSGPPGRRHQAMLVLLCLGLLPALMAGGPVALAVLLVPAACAASPAVATGFASAGSIAGPERLAEAFAWCAAALGAGLAVGTAVAGTVADAAGSRAVILAGSALAAAGALAAWGGLRLSASNALHLVGDSRGGAAVSLARPGVRE